VIRDPATIRNIGISAHIDSGKTTLTERILFYTKRIHAIHEVKGKDLVGAKMDSMDLERERGITIQSAATHCRWHGHHINIIDTPGHVDFTIEVERALRVLDGAILVLCGVAGVQSQSLTVDRQMRRYGIPRLGFVNKCDRAGANPQRVCEQLRDQLGLNPVLMQLPIGLEDRFEGVVDLVTEEALFFDGAHGETVRREPIPGSLVREARAARERLLDAVSMFSDELTEALLEERVGVEAVRAALRKATLAHQILPVLVGSAYRNRGVQPLLDAVAHYLPSPRDAEASAIDVDEGTSVRLGGGYDEPLVMLAFKVDEGRYGQLTYLRVYQGTVRRGDTITNARSGRAHKVGRLVRMHADEMEEIEAAAAGDIVAMFGVECASSDTFTSGGPRVTMASMHVPAPVLSLAVKTDTRSMANLTKALRRFAKEDPTFRVTTDGQTGETRVSGMGELHLEVYLERVRREYGVQVETSPPAVAYREAITLGQRYDYTHRKQTGGAGQFGRVAGRIEPLAGGDYEFSDETVGGVVPREFVTSVNKGFRSMLGRGMLIGAPVVGVRVVLDDGAAHAVDSSDLAFQEAARGAWRATYAKCGPQILEPIMRVVVEAPGELVGSAVATLLKRRGIVVGTTELEGGARVEAHVPLAEMFGFSTALRSATQGKGEFTMELWRYGPVPEALAQELVRRHELSRRGPAKD
jgi:elongation factor G